MLPEWDGDSSIRSPIETVAGGSALNTAVQLSALLRTRRQRVQARPFRRCVLHSRIGRDLYGDLVAARIREAGVTLSARREGAQGVCICLSGEQDRAFVSYKGSVADLTEEDIDWNALLVPGTAHLHFSAYYDCAGLQPSVPKLVEAVKSKRGATVSIVPQCDSSGEYGGGLLELLPQIDVLVCNQREACSIAGVAYGCGSDGDDASSECAAKPTWAETDEAVRRLQQAGAPLIVITLGSQGAIAVDRSSWWFQPTRPRPVVDTTGCGDAFAAGFLFGWCGSRDVRRGLVYGCACGAAAVGQVGGSEPIDVQEINACMRRNEGMMLKRSAECFAGLHDECAGGGVSPDLQTLLAQTEVAPAMS